MFGRDLNSRAKRRLRRGAIGFFFFILLNIAWNLVPATKNLEQFSLDFRYQHFNRDTKANKQVVYVDIDETSMKTLASTYGRWPWPRRVYKELLEFLSIGEPAGVFFDLLFTESQFGTKDDELLGDASNSGSMVVSHAMNLLMENGQGLSAPNPLPQDFNKRFSLPIVSDDDSLKIEGKNSLFWDYATPNSAIYSKSKYLHSVNFERGRDGIFRELRLLYQYKEQWIPSLVLAATLSTVSNPEIKIANRAIVISNKNKSLRIELEKNTNLPIHFYKLDNGVERIGIDVILTSAAKLQKGEVSDPAELKVNPLEFKDKVIIIGGSAAGLEDLKATPITQSYPGAMLNATAISNILSQDFLKKVPEFVSVLSVTLIMLICYFVALFASSIYVKVFIPFGIVVFNFLLAIYLFHFHSYQIEVMRPAVLALGVVLDSLAYLSFIEGAERKRLKSTLMKFVSPSVANAMIESGKNPAAEVGRTEELSVLFSDIRGFTTLSERFKPDFLVEWLNQYFAKMTKIVFDRNGTLDKFIGDALMAFWGAPNRQENHAYLSVSSALAMRQALLELLEEWKVKYKGSVKIDIGIGINSGEVVVGNIGSDQRLEYTVIGDNVNLASRIEGLTKFYGVGVLVSYRTKDLSEEHFLFRIIDCVQVKGKTKGVFLYEPLAEKRFLSPEQQHALSDKALSFERAWRLYEAGDFLKALESFQEFAKNHVNDGPCELYITRCKELLESPPTEWSGIYVAKSK